LKKKAEDGKSRLTDVDDTEQLFRLIQSIPSPNAEPFKQWLAKIGCERIDENQDSEKSFCKTLYFLKNRINLYRHLLLLQLRNCLNLVLSFARGHKCQ
jgi:hypothetical protein